MERPVTDYGQFLRLETTHSSPGPTEGSEAQRTLGMPALPWVCEESLPVKSLKIKLRDGEELELDTLTTARGQQVAASGVLEEYHALIAQLVYRLHQPPCWDHTDERQTSIHHTIGATNGLSQIFRALLSPGDVVLTEEMTFPGATTQLSGRSITRLPVDCDEFGIIPEALIDILTNWPPPAKESDVSLGSGQSEVHTDSSQYPKNKPKLLYLIPTGQNPMGMSMSLERKKRIYQVAQEHDLLIFEDDAYYLLTYGELVPSFLSMDTDGRVIRCSTFSKTIAPGYRAGFMSGPRGILDQVQTRLSSAQVPVFSQMIVLALLKKWTVEGFIERSKKVAAMYKSRQNVMVRLADKWLTGLVEYSVPSAGMFLWCRVVGCSDTKLFLDSASKFLLLLSPGIFFYPAPESAASCPYIRIAYSNASESDVNTAFQRLAEMIRYHQTLAKA